MPYKVDVLSETECILFLDVCCWVEFIVAYFSKLNIGVSNFGNMISSFSCYVTEIHIKTESELQLDLSLKQLALLNIFQNVYKKTLSRKSN